jgi:hypothetical protein
MPAWAKRRKCGCRENASASTWFRPSPTRAKCGDRIAAAARPFFKLFGHEDHLKVEHPDCKHDFPPEMREVAYKLFDKILGGT